MPAYVSIRQHTSAYVRRRRRGSSFGCLHTSAYISIRQHTSAYVSIRQHTSAYVSIRQHTSAYVSMRQHTSAYVSIRQHTSAYVSIRPHIIAVRQGELFGVPATPASVFVRFNQQCTSKASKLRTSCCVGPTACGAARRRRVLLHQ